MSPSRSKREAVETASRALRDRQRAESGQLAAAESALRRADRDHDREARERGLAQSGDAEPPGAAGSDEARIAARGETRTVLAELGERLKVDEDALDMAAVVHAGHDGVLVATDRRLMFVAPRRRLSIAYDGVESVHVRSHRWSGSGLTVRSTEGRTTFSAIRPSHANELAELVCARAGVPAG